MTERHDFKRIIADIEAAGITLYKLALMMHCQYIQIQRIKKTGRCQHHVGETLLGIHREYVGTLQSVPRGSAIAVTSI